MSIKLPPPVLFQLSEPGSFVFKYTAKLPFLIKPAKYEVQFIFNASTGVMNVNIFDGSFDDKLQPVTEQSFADEILADAYPRYQALASNFDMPKYTTINRS